MFRREGEVFRLGTAMDVVFQHVKTVTAALWPPTRGALYDANPALAQGAQRRVQRAAAGALEASLAATARP